MSSIAYVPDTIRRSKSRDRRTEGLEKLFSLIILFLLLVLAGELLFHFVISPRLVLSNIVIEAAADFPMADEEILELGGIQSGASFFSVDPELVSQRLSSVPYIKKVQVERSFPNKLHIGIQEREAIATILASGESKSGDNKSSTLFVSRDGAVFPRPGLVVTDMPVISGIEIPQVGETMFLPKQLLHSIYTFEKTHQDAPELYRLISELKFVKKRGNDYEVVLFPAHRRIRVRIGATLNEQLLAYIMMVLDVLGERELFPDLEEIDFRTGEVVYKVREDQGAGR